MTLRHAAALLALLPLVACVSQAPPPDPLRADDIGRYVGGPVADGEGFVSACGAGPWAHEARAGVRDWLDVLAHTDACAIGQINYQLAQRGAYTRALRQLAQEPGACGQQAARLDRRLASFAARVGTIARENAVSCGVDAVGEDVRRVADDTMRQSANLQNRIARDFPELGGGI